MDGRALKNGRIPFANDGATHKITVTMGAESAPNLEETAKVETTA